VSAHAIPMAVCGASADAKSSRTASGAASVSMTVVACTSTRTVRKLATSTQNAPQDATSPRSVGGASDRSATKTTAHASVATTTSA